MTTRRAVQAGAFYDASAASLREQAREILEQAHLPDDLPARLYGGLVPHAGWVYSGRVAALTMAALGDRANLDSLVLFGADHTGMVRAGEVYDFGAWETPLGAVGVDEELARCLLAAADDCLRANPGAHAREHSLEVQLPLLQVLAPRAKIVPIAVPVNDLAPRIGEAVGTYLATHRPDVPILGSTDLTHHGGHFGSPGGQGLAGVAWARDNDQRLLDLVATMDAPAIVPEVLRRHNACGGGAVAAAIAACKALGATRALCLKYTNSFEVLRELGAGGGDYTTVGYASVVFA